MHPVSLPTHLSEIFPLLSPIFPAAGMDALPDPSHPPSPGSSGGSSNRIGVLLPHNYLALVSGGRFSENRPGHGPITSPWGRPDDIILLLFILSLS